MTSSSSTIAPEGAVDSVDTVSKGVVLMMAGGTGGHVIPALSLARALAAAGHEIHWLGSSRGIELRSAVSTPLSDATF